MSASSSHRKEKDAEVEEEEGGTAAAAAAESTEVEKNPRRMRMTQEQIDWLSRYQTVHMPEEAFRNLRTKDVLPPEDLAYQGNLPVPMGQLDDYLANICREINQMEARFLRRRDRILNDYAAKGYAEYAEEEEE